MLKTRITSAIYNYYCVLLKHQEPTQIYKDQQGKIIKQSYMLDTLEIETPRAPQPQHIKFVLWFIDYYLTNYRTNRPQELQINWWKLHQIYKFKSIAEAQEKIFGVIYDLRHTNICDFSKKKPTYFKFFDNFSTNDAGVTLTISNEFLNVLDPEPNTPKSQKKKIAVKSIDSAILDINSKATVLFCVLCYILLLKRTRLTADAFFTVAGVKRYKQIKNGQVYEYYKKRDLNKALKEISKMYEIKITNANNKQIIDLKKRSKSNGRNK